MSEICFNYAFFKFCFSSAPGLIVSCFSLGKSLRKVGQDSTVLLICITVFLSYLPEAGQYSCFFLYLKQVTVYLQAQVLRGRLQFKMDRTLNTGAVFMIISTFSNYYFPTIPPQCSPAYKSQKLLVGKLR